MATKDPLVGLSDYVAERTRDRMQGLTDDEYGWTPVDDCWTAGPDGAGGLRVDGTFPAPDPPPFTTLAWRLHHLMGCYSGDRNAAWLDVESTGDPLADESAQPVDAASALALLERCQATWRGYLVAVTDETLAAALGEKGGQYADSTGADHVLHQIDEQIHHGAEIALLRDLYHRLVVAPRDPAVLALMGGDASADSAEVQTIKRDPPQLLTEAALSGAPGWCRPSSGTTRSS